MSKDNDEANQSPTQPFYFASSTELADLGRERFDHETAEITNRDHALLANQPVVVRAGRAPKGLENKVHQWNVFQHTTEERDDREERKGDLHEGQLHRQNRAAREPQGFGVMGGGTSESAGGLGGVRGRGSTRGRGGGRGEVRGGRENNMVEEGLCAGRKPEGNAPPLAKGFAEELDKSMFWDGPIA